MHPHVCFIRVKRGQEPRNLDVGLNLKAIKSVVVNWKVSLGRDSSESSSSRLPNYHP
jgi:hypothetical protein